MKSIEITTYKGVFVRKAKTLNDAVVKFMAKHQDHVFLFAQDLKYQSFTQQFKNGKENTLG